MLPHEPQDGSVLNIKQLQEDFMQFQDTLFGNTMTERLKTMIRLRQQSLPAGLTKNRLQGFEKYPKYKQLSDMATNGISPFMNPNFIPNQG